MLAPRRLAHFVADSSGVHLANMSATGLALLVIVTAWSLLISAYARRLLADWREPVLALPVMIVESDDWGPGPPMDAVRLQEIADVLRQFHDSLGSPPVVTLGVVLAVPSRDGLASSGLRQYNPQALDAPAYATICHVLLAGRDAGVFPLQLHGMEHFWPPALLQVTERESAVRSFLNAENGVQRHEALPSHLQARWIDASRLPSVALNREAVERAVAEETACFARVFGAAARVAVPVTFTWTAEVEAAWARHGIRVVVSPGTRYIGRDEQARPIGDGSILRNGDIGAGGIVYVVRDIYFEPALGHRAERTLQEIRAHHRLGRPALLEMHRFNFTGDATQAENSLAELRYLLQGALTTIPDLRFISTEELAAAMITRDPALIDLHLAARVRAFVLRAATQPRLRKLAWISGLAFAAAAAFGVASAVLPPPASGRRNR